MPLFYLVILAVLQGITEFLPISSSAHLVLLPRLSGQPDQGLVLDVAVHVGSLLAVMLFFRRDILSILFAFTKDWKNQNEDVKLQRRLGKIVVAASIPVIIVGFILHWVMPEGIRDIRVIAGATIFFALLLWWADRHVRDIQPLETMRRRNVLLIGFAQVLALVPGTSRSGITMTMGLFLGLSRVQAARFSLLLSMPAIAGAGLLQAFEIIKSGNIVLGLDALIGVVLAFIASYVAISVMMRWLKTYSFTPFVIYRLILGSVLLLYIMV